METSRETAQVVRPRLTPVLAEGAEPGERGTPPWVLNVKRQPSQEARCWQRHGCDPRTSWDALTPKAHGFIDVSCQPGSWVFGCFSRIGSQAPARP